MVQRLGLSEAATAALEASFPRVELMEEMFQFDREEFQRNAPYRAVELDNGGLLIAENARFNQVFNEEIGDADERRVRYITEGRVVDERLRKAK